MTSATCHTWNLHHNIFSIGLYVYSFDKDKVNIYSTIFFSSSLFSLRLYISVTVNQNMVRLYTIRLNEKEYFLGQHHAARNMLLYYIHFHLGFSFSLFNVVVGILYSTQSILIQSRYEAFYPSFFLYRLHFENFSFCTKVIEIRSFFRRQPKEIYF